MRALVMLVWLGTLACAGEQPALAPPAPPPALKEISPAPARAIIRFAPEARLLDWPELLKSGKLRIGLTGRIQDARTKRAMDAGLALEEALNAKVVTPQGMKVEFYSLLESDVARAVQRGFVDIGANVRLSFERDEQVAFATPIRTGVRELIVLSPSQPPLVSLEDVGNRSIHVPISSDHLASMQRLNDQLKKIDRPPATVVVEKADTTESLLAKVNDGTIAGTVIDDDLYEALKGRAPNAKVNRDVAVSQDGVIAWVTRKDAPQLLALINEFFATHKLTF